MVGYVVRRGVFLLWGILGVSTSNHGVSCYEFAILGDRWSPFIVQRVLASNMIDRIVDLDIGIQPCEGRYRKG